jgi:hypothetical protein
LKALSMGLPVVTLPTEFARGRNCMLIYKHTGYTVLVAETPKQYIEIAVRLAMDAKFKAEAKSRITETAPVPLRTKKRLSNGDVFRGGLRRKRDRGAKDEGQEMIDHVSIDVSDLEKSTAFFWGCWAPLALRNSLSGRIQLDLGKSIWNFGLVLGQII